METSEAYLEPMQTSVMENFGEKVNIFQPLTIFAKISIIDALQDPKYASELSYAFLHETTSWTQDVSRTYTRLPEDVQDVLY